jgi:hypothetical protein
MAKQNRLFTVETTISAPPYSRFQITALDIKLAVTKADNIIKGIDKDAEVTKVESIAAALLEE